MLCALFCAYVKTAILQITPEQCEQCEILPCMSMIKTDMLREPMLHWDMVWVSSCKTHCPELSLVQEMTPSNIHLGKLPTICHLINLLTEAYIKYLQMPCVFFPL